MSKTKNVKSEVILTEMGDGSGVLLDVATKFYYTLNETGVLVWKCSARGERSEAAIAGELVAQFDVDPERARSDVAALLAELRSEGLLCA